MQGMPLSCLSFREELKGPGQGTVLCPSPLKEQETHAVERTMMKNNKRDEVISIAQAQALLCGAAKPVDSEVLAPEDSLGRILAQDLIARMNQPPFRRSAMDGYALRSADIAGAGLEDPVCLQVAGKLYAGDAPLPPGSLHSGQALRIMTGAPVPEDADCVIRQEDTDLGMEKVRIYRALEEMDNVCPVGEDFSIGECLCQAGTKIDAYALSCACAAGVTAWQVRKRIRVGLLMTGNELCAPGTPLQPGKIYNSSEAFLKGRLRELGCTVEESVFTEDDQSVITDTIRKMAGRVDLIITTGGVSVGERDLIPAALEDLQACTLFHGIAVKPGMPTLGAVYENVPVLGLSGNPFSAAAIFELLGRPLIHRMLGCTGQPFGRASALLTSDVLLKGGVPRVMMGILDAGRVTVCGQQRNAQMKYAVGNNCIVIFPPEKRVFTAGDRVEVLL